MKHTDNSNDWNNIDVNKLVNKDQREITKLYNLTKGYFLSQIQNCEELFNDVILHIVRVSDQYDPDKGKFSSFLITIMLNLRQKKWRDEKRKKRPNTLSLPPWLIEDLSLSKLTVYNRGALELFVEGWTIPQLEEFESILQQLTTEERQFIESYRKEQAEEVQRRKKFAKIKQKVVAISVSRSSACALSGRTA